MFFTGLFCGFRAVRLRRAGFLRGFCAAGGGAVQVRAISSILHQVGNCKVELAAAQGAAARAYCVLASNSNWRFRFREKEDFLAFL